MCGLEGIDELRGFSTVRPAVLNGTTVTEIRSDCPLYGNKRNWQLAVSNTNCKLDGTKNKIAVAYYEF